MKLRSALVPATLVITMACYKPTVSQAAIDHVSEVDAKNLPPNLEPMGTVEVSVAGGSRYTHMGEENGRAALYEATYKRGADCFAIILVKHGMSTTDVVAKVYKKTAPKP
jgi:hypothetical protein